MFQITLLQNQTPRMYILAWLFKRRPSPGSKLLYVPGYETCSLTPTEAIKIYDKIEQDELLVPLQFPNEPIKPSISHHRGTGSITDHHLKMVYLSDSASSMCN